jgi:hypothetical protein
MPYDELIHIDHPTMKDAGHTATDAKTFADSMAQKGISDMDKQAKTTPEQAETKPFVSSTAQKGISDLDKQAR